MKEKGAASGVPTLDADGKIPAAQIPDLSPAYGRTGAGVARFIARAKAGSTLKIVGIGDSILAGTGATVGVDDTLTRTLKALQSRFPASAITQSNRAVSGATTATTGINGTLSAAIAEAGDLYIIGFGRNDIQADDAAWGTQPVQGYRCPRSLRYYEVIIRSIRERVPQADILLMTENPGANYSSDANMRTYQGGVCELAVAYGAELADTYTAWGSSGYSALLNDAVHPSVAGHQKNADTIMSRIPATPPPTASGVAAATLAKGLRTPESVDISIGSYGWTVMNGSAPTAAYTQSGAGWSTNYPRQTSVAGNQAEFVFIGTDFGIRVDHTSAAAPVVDIAIDGVTVFAKQSLFISPSAYQLFQFIATGLTPGQHTIRLTLVSGTLRWYQSAWLAGPATTTASTTVIGAAGGLRRMVPGRYYSNKKDSSPTGTTSFLNAGDMYVAPLWVPTGTAFSKIAANVTAAAAGSSVALGVYDSNEYDQPRSLILAPPPLSSSTTGWKEASITQTLLPGMYWVALLALAGAPRVSGTSQPHEAVASSAATFSNPLCGYVATGAASLPTTWSSTAAATAVPLVALKAT
ncbi:SGNH/GDSL hydrolase family protein [Arthrobacter sp. RT-1]|nr:SGNH/GDSL hydrolase family protein [Arthrobacter sp. RT-1]